MTRSTELKMSLCLVPNEFDISLDTPDIIPKYGKKKMTWLIRQHVTRSGFQSGKTPL